MTKEYWVEFQKYKHWEVVANPFTLHVQKFFNDGFICSGLFSSHCLSDSGLYQTGQRQCSGDPMLVNTLPSPWSWQPAKIGMRPNLVGPSAQSPWLKQSPDIAKGRPKKNVLSYKVQSLEWFILLMQVVIYHWMPVIYTWLSAASQEF